MTASGSWKTSSGLLDDFDFSIEEAWFGTHEKFPDTTLLHLRGIAEQEVDGELIVVDDEHTLLYSLGDGWEIANGGREASHSAGKTTFTNNSNMGRLIDAVVALGSEVLGELADRGQTYEADTWEGLRFHIERKVFSYKDRETQETRTYEVPLPIDYLGAFEPEEETKPKPKKRGSGARGRGRTKAKAAEETETEEEAEEAPAPKRGRGRKKANSALFDAVVEFAAEYEDHSSFVEDVFDPDEFDQAEELQADEELAADVLDEDGKVWTAAGELEE